MDASTPLEEITKIHGTQIIDSLPYIDPPVDKEKVRRLILEETRNFTRKNYLENVPNVDLNVDVRFWFLFSQKEIECEKVLVIFDFQF